MANSEQVAHDEAPAPVCPEHEGYCITCAEPAMVVLWQRPGAHLLPHVHHATMQRCKLALRSPPRGSQLPG